MIPKKMAQIWIGPRNPPTSWMESWKTRHQDWQYTLLNNEYLLSRKWKCYRQISRYIYRNRLEGVSELMRYEYLCENGVVMPDADSISLQSVDGLFTENMVYGVYENEVTRPNYCSPYIAAPKGHEVLERIVSKLSKVDPNDLERPWKSVGNLFLARFHEKRGCVEKALVKILPSRSFNSGSRLAPNEALADLSAFGNDVYALKMWGTSADNYGQFGPGLTSDDFEEGCQELGRKFDAAMTRLCCH